MGAQTSRLHRSSIKDVKDNVNYCLEELSKWEDGAALVRELLQTDLRHPSASLAAFGGPSERLVHHFTPGSLVSGASGPLTPHARATEPGAETPHEREMKEEPGFDPAAYRQLLHSVDEVLEQGQGKEYFRNIAKERLERIMTSPASWFVLPPMGLERGQSSSRLFAIAALESLMERQHELGKGSSKSFGLLEHLKGKSTVGLHKRLSEDVYGGVSQSTEERAMMQEAERLPERSPRVARPVTEEEEEEVLPSSSTAHPTQERGMMERLGEAVGLGSSRREEEEYGGRERKSSLLSSLSGSSGYSERESKEAAEFAAPATHSHETMAAGSDIGAGGGARAGETLHAASATGSESTALETLDNQRIVVAAKYLFISRFLDTLLQTAIFNFKAAVRLGSLKRRFKNEKEFGALPLVQQHRMKKLAEINSIRVERGLIAFDRARIAFGWLLHNYAIGAASFKVNAAIVNLKSLLRDVRADRGLAAHMRAGEKEALYTDANMMLHWFDRRHVQLLLEQQANERDALSIGMSFLDGNLDGAVEVTELSDFSAKLFTQLDQKRKSRFSHDELQATINSLCNRLEAKQTELHLLRAENARLRDRSTDQAAYQHEKNADLIAKLEESMEEPKWSLRNIYSYFHSAFVQHVFPRIVPSARLQGDLSDYAAIPFLQAELDKLEERRAELPLDKEFRMGKYLSKISAARPESLGPHESGRSPQELLLGERGASKTSKHEPAAIRSQEEARRIEYAKDEERKQAEKAAPLTAALPSMSERSQAPRASGVESGAQTESAKPSLTERMKSAIGVGGGKGASAVGEKSELPESLSESRSQLEPRSSQRTELRGIEPEQGGLERGGMERSTELPSTQRGSMERGSLEPSAMERVTGLHSTERSTEHGGAERATGPMERATGSMERSGMERSEAGYGTERAGHGVDTGGMALSESQRGVERGAESRGQEPSYKQQAESLMQRYSGVSGAEKAHVSPTPAKEPLVPSSTTVEKSYAPSSAYSGTSYAPSSAEKLATERKEASVPMGGSVSEPSTFEKIAETVKSALGVQD